MSSLPPELLLAARLVQPTEAPPAEPTPETSAAEPAPAGLPEGLELPQMSDTPALVYPASLAAQADPPVGIVTIAYVVGVDGNILQATVTQSLHPSLDRIALEALLRSQHAPATFHGEPVEVKTNASFAFEAPPPVVEAEPEPEPEPVVEAEPEPEALAPIRMQGQLLTAGERQPIAGAVVVAVPGEGLDAGRLRGAAARKWHAAEQEPAWTVEAETDAEGRFALRGVPPGRVVLIFVAQGYERYEYVVDVDAQSVVEGRYYQTRLDANPYRMVVETEREQPAEVTRRTVEAAEVARAPGSGGDSVRGLLNMPGFSRTPFGLGSLVIRGAAPGDSAVYLGGHEIPQVFHFGGLASTFNSELIDSLDYIPSNFGGRYGDATGGIVAIEPRAPRRDGVHGYVDADVVDVSAVVEGPLGRGGFAVGGRISYLDRVLKAVDTPIGPRYWDYQALFDHPVGKGTIGFRLLGSGDELQTFVDTVEDFAVTNGFHRGDIYYRRAVGKWSFLASESFSAASSTRFDNAIDDYTFSTRLEARWSASEHVGLVFGNETRAGWSNLELRGPALAGGRPSVPGAAAPASEQTTPAVSVGSYATANLRWGEAHPVTISPGVRATVYALPQQQVGVDPRLNARWDVADRWALKAGVGLYSQAPTLLELDEVFGNPDLDLERSMQASGGFEVSLPLGISLDVTGFYKHLWDVTVPSDDLVERGGNTVPERFASTGTGRSYGGELLVRRDFSARLYGWAAYTLSRTELRGRSGESFALAPSDQTHILTLLGGYRLPRNWTIGLRFRLTSGSPTTPTANGIYDTSTARWQPFAAPAGSDRLPLFHQLDLRVDKTWSFRLMKLNAYLDIQNVYNAQNAEFVIPSYDFRESARVNALPFFPSLGLKVSW